MSHEYDLFEKFPDGSSLWRACAIGLENARLCMSELSRQSPHQFYAMNVMSGKIIPIDFRQHGFLNQTKTKKRAGSAAA